MDICAICKKNINDQDQGSVQKLYQKGCEKLRSLSLDDSSIEVGQSVHKKCRADALKATPLGDEQPLVSSNTIRRSTEIPYRKESCCLFCGAEVTTRQLQSKETKKVTK